MNTKYAFSDRMIFPDENIFKQSELSQNDSDEASADEKNIASHRGRAFRKLVEFLIPKNWL